jgi:Transposase DDE domain
VKSFRPKHGSDDPPGPGRNGERDFHGERRRNDTHASTTDADARLFRKGPGKEARLSFMGHALMENRNGLVVGAVATRASGHAERLAALALIEPHAERPRPLTLGADKGYHSTDFVMELREQAVTPAPRSEPQQAAFSDRRAYHPPSRLRGLAAHPQAHRRGLRLGQDGGRAAQAAAPRTAQGRLAIHPDDGRLRSRPVAEIAGRGRTMTIRLGPLAAPPVFSPSIARDRRPRPHRYHSRQPITPPRRPIAPKFDRFSAAC